MNEFENNIELLLQYIDGELDPAQEQELLKQLENDPRLQHELKMLEQTRLVADESIIFPRKELLLKPVSGKRRYFVYYRWSAAAAVLLAAALFYLINSRQGAVYREIAVTPPENESRSGIYYQPEKDRGAENIAPRSATPEVKVKSQPVRKSVVKSRSTINRSESSNSIPEVRSKPEAVTINRGVLLLLPPPEITPELTYNSSNISFVPNILPAGKKSRRQKMREEAGELAGRVINNLSGRMGSPKISIIKEEVERRTVYTFSFENNKVKYTGKF